MGILSKIKTIREEKEDKQKIVVLYEHVPEEIISAAGFIPYRIFPSSKLKDDKGYLNKNACSYARMIFAGLISSEYDSFAGVVGVNTCDAMRRIFEVFKNYKTIGYMKMLDLPRLKNEKAESRFFKEFESLKKDLDLYSGTFVTNEKLREAIKIHNETRDILKEFCVLRKENKLNAIEMLELAKLSMQIDREKFNKFAREIFSELKHELSDNPKVILCGSVSDRISILKLLNKHVNLVIEESNIITRNCWRNVEGNNLAAIAKKYLEDIPMVKMEDRDRIEHIKNLLEFYRAKGIIYINFKFCDLHHLSAEKIKEALKVPFLKIELDYASSDLGQIETRVQAFSEMLK